MEKFYKQLFITLTMVMMTLCFSACSDDKDEPSSSKNSVVGTWYQENSTGTKITITFKANQTGNVKYEFKSGSDKSEYFEYNIQTDSDGDTYIFITSDECQLVGRHEVIVTPSTLTLIGSINGSYGTYQFKKK